MADAKGSIPIQSNMSYESPFLDMTSFYMPKTIKELFSFINVALYSDPLVSQCIMKLAEYPITKLQYIDDKGSVNTERVEKRWKVILEDNMKITDAMKTCGMDYYGYGTSLVSINYPFKRMLTCKSCKHTQSVDAAKTIFKNYKFVSTCSKCGDKGDKIPRDIPTKEIKKLGFVFWDLMNIFIKYNNISGEHFFYYTVPNNISKAISQGDMDIVSGTRLEIIEAIAKKKKLKLSPSNLFHYKRPGPQYMYPEQRGWGVPVTMSVLKDIFYKRLLRKGNEAIAFEHIVPLRVIFPQGTGDVSPHAMMNLSTWKEKIEHEIVSWKRDPNRVAIVPVPIGQLSFGGDGKILMVSQEIKLVDEDIMTGIGIIPEIIKGGASWSGSNVSLRVVENTFLNHRKSMKSFIDWAKTNVARYLDIEPIEINMDDFKMADDLQRKQMLLQAVANNQISLETALRELDLDPDVEYRQILDEVKKQTEVNTRKAEGQAEADGAAMVTGAMFQADAQFEAQQRSEMHNREQQSKNEEVRSKDMEERAAGAQEEMQTLSNGQGIADPNNPAGPQMSVTNLIAVLTRRFANLAQVDKEEFKMRMLNMKNSSPNLYGEVYDNLIEANVIAAEVDPASTGPSNASGEEGAPSAPSGGKEDSAGGGGGGEAGAPTGNPLPEAKPPQGPNASV